MLYLLSCFPCLHHRLSCVCIYAFRHLYVFSVFALCLGIIIAAIILLLFFSSFSLFFFVLFCFVRIYSFAREKLYILRRHSSTKVRSTRYKIVSQRICNCLLPVSFISYPIHGDDTFEAILFVMIAMTSAENAEEKKRERDEGERKKSFQFWSTLDVQMNSPWECKCSATSHQNANVTLWHPTVTYTRLVCLFIPFNMIMCVHRFVMVVCCRDVMVGLADAFKKIWIFNFNCV